MGCDGERKYVNMDNVGRNGASGSKDKGSAGLDVNLHEPVKYVNAEEVNGNSANVLTGNGETAQYVTNLSTEEVRYVNLDEASRNGANVLTGNEEAAQYVTM